MVIIDQKTVYNAIPLDCDISTYELFKKLHPKRTYDVSSVLYKSIINKIRFLRYRKLIVRTRVINHISYYKRGLLINKYKRTVRILE